MGICMHEVRMCWSGIRSQSHNIISLQYGKSLGFEFRCMTLTEDTWGFNWSQRALLGDMSIFDEDTALDNTTNIEEDTIKLCYVALKI